MTSHIILHLVRLKIESDKEPDKEYIRHYVLSCFHQKKSAADAHKIICETYGKNVRTRAN